MRKAIKKEKNKKRKKIAISFICFFTVLIIFSGFYIVKWFLDNSKTKNVNQDIENLTEVQEIQDNDNTEIITQENANKDDPYWDFIKMNLINVNFQELKKQNSDTVGWIQVSGTNINYPFVQVSNNDYYLTHSFDKTNNQAGWVFLDYRNNIQTLNKNTIIYGHSRLNKTMFGSLINIFTNGWLNNTNNYVIKLSTETENTLWQVFSIYHIPTTSDYLDIDFNSDQEFLNFANMLLKRSQHNFKTSVSSKDYILTLSTCYKDTERAVLHAKLIKKEKRI